MRLFKRGKIWWVTVWQRLPEKGVDGADEQAESAV